MKNKSKSSIQTKQLLKCYKYRNFTENVLNIEPENRKA